MITTVLIDIDNTLLDFNKCSRKAMIDACKLSNIEFSEDMISVFHKINDSLWAKIETGEITRDELLKTRWNLVFNEMGIEFDGKLFEKHFVNGLHEGHEPVEGAKELAEYLSKKYILAAASNGPYEQQQHRLTLAGIIDCFSYLFVSEKIGCAKPANEFFEQCLKQLSEKDKNNIIIIGDSPTADIAGGKAFGIKTLWYNHNRLEFSPVKADYTVNSLYEIMNIL